MIRAAIAGLFALAPATSGAAPCVAVDFDGKSYTVCTADPARDEIRLWLRGRDGTILGTFDRVDEMLAERGERLAFAMNGGMYHEDRRPVGHFRDPDREEMRVVTGAGPGNFGMVPNGVLCIGDGDVAIHETTAYAAAAPECRYATQSGPLLVRDGALHPRFKPQSQSRFIRNGVGVDTAGRAVFAISDEPVNFHEFARLFRDALDAPNALYLDGNVSRLYAPGIRRHDIGLPMGPIVGMAVPRD